MNKVLRELADGDRVTIRVLLSSKSRGVTAKGAPYLSFVLQDKSGTMDAKYWNVPEQLLDQYEAGMVVDATGDILNHNHQLQMRVKQIEIVKENVDARDFAQASPISENDLKNEIEKILGSIKNETLKLLVDTVYQKYEKDFYEYPAATKNHRFCRRTGNTCTGNAAIGCFRGPSISCPESGSVDQRCLFARPRETAGAERSHCAKLYDTGKTVGAYLDVSGGNYENSISARH